MILYNPFAVPEPKDSSYDPFDDLEIKYGEARENIERGLGGIRQYLEYISIEKNCDMISHYLAVYESERVDNDDLYSLSSCIRRLYEDYLARFCVLNKSAPLEDKKKVVEEWCDYTKYILSELMDEILGQELYFKNMYIPKHLTTEEYVKIVTPRIDKAIDTCDRIKEKYREEYEIYKQLERKNKDETPFAASEDSCAPVHKLPDELTIAQEAFDLATEAGFMTPTAYGYKWNGTIALLAYFIDRLCSRYNIGDYFNREKRIQWKLFSPIFGIRAESLKDAKNTYINKTESVPQGSPAIDELLERVSGR